jgi:hypothetical protein
MRTSITPSASGANRANVAWSKSMMRSPPPNGPRPSIVQVAVAPVARLVTVTTVPRGSVGLAHAPAAATYQVAWPVSDAAGGAVVGGGGGRVVDGRTGGRVVGGAVTTARRMTVVVVGITRHVELVVVGRRATAGVRTMDAGGTADEGGGGAVVVVEGTAAAVVTGVVDPAGGVAAAKPGPGPARRRAATGARF